MGSFNDMKRILFGSIGRAQILYVKMKGFWHV